MQSLDRITSSCQPLRVNLRYFHMREVWAHSGSTPPKNLCGHHKWFRSRFHSKFQICLLGCTGLVWVGILPLTWWPGSTSSEGWTSPGLDMAPCADGLILCIGGVWNRSTRGASWPCTFPFTREGIPLPENLGHCLVQGHFSATLGGKPAFHWNVACPSHS